MNWLWFVPARSDNSIPCISSHWFCRFRKSQSHQNLWWYIFHNLKTCRQRARHPKQNKWFPARCFYYWRPQHKNEALWFLLTFYSKTIPKCWATTTSPTKYKRPKTKRNFKIFFSFAISFRIFHWLGKYILFFLSLAFCELLLVLAYLSSFCSRARLEAQSPQTANDW